MRKHLSVVLAIVLLALAFLPASADPPEPAYYSVALYGACWLPNGAAVSTNVLKAQPELEPGLPNRITASCRGYLPDHAPRPKEALKLSFEQTQIPCRVEIGRQVFVTTNYGATVYPNGVSEITCRVNLDW